MRPIYPPKPIAMIPLSRILLLQNAMSKFVSGHCANILVFHESSIVILLLTTIYVIISATSETVKMTEAHILC